MQIYSVVPISRDIDPRITQGHDTEPLGRSSAARFSGSHSRRGRRRQFRPARINLRSQRTTSSLMIVI